MKKWEILSKKENFKNEDEIISELAKNRKIEKSEVENFFNPKLSSVTLKSVGIKKNEIKKTLQRINESMERNKKIIIYGDYDVDGICGTAILWEVIYSKYKNVFPYIPHRVDEGYGLSKKGIENLLLENEAPAGPRPGIFSPLLRREQNPSEAPLSGAKGDSDIDLIITVDNGIVANAAVDFAKEKGIDVIVTDHHVAGKILPDAFSIVHTTQLCGTGVAWMLACEFDSENKELETMLELVALATVADLVPLRDSNRTLLFFGLKKLRETKRVGLLALLKEARIEKENIDTYEIGHIIAPRLNASGRISHALDGLRLICTKDRARAEQLAMQLGNINRERQSMTQENTAVAKVLFTSFKQTTRLIFSHDKKYNQGVIGLVASRLVEEYYRPSIVVAVGEKISKGSARSITGVNIIELIRMGQHYLIDAGGHPMAAGFTIETKRIEVFKKFLETKAKEVVREELLDRVLLIDLKLNISQITNSLYKKTKAFAPFGMKNYEPVFASDVTMEDFSLIGKDRKHVKFKFSQDGNSFEGIGFGIGEKAGDFHIGDKVKIAYTIDENKWLARNASYAIAGGNGNSKLQLKIKGIKAF